MRIIIIICFVLINFLKLAGQENDPVLFWVNDIPVQVSEFEYIYNKNNGEDADYSKESIEEYLDLYINFKLKVQRAKDMGLDTIKALQNELAGYRKQLANSYLLDKEVTKKLIHEAFDRIQQDVHVHHILVRVESNAPKEIQEASYKKALQLLSDIENSSFEEIASLHSDDKHSAKNGGDIGFLTALMPKGFYEFENAIYSLQPGEISEPVKSKAGYHLIKISEKRPARGEMNVSHILIRKNKHGKTVSHAREKVDTIYNLLSNGGDFKLLAKQFSEDLATASKGGNLGFFGINRFENAFEEAAFSLPNDGDISVPVETSIGWHIIQRHAYKDFKDFEQLKNELQTKVSKDDRYTIARESMIRKIQEEGGFSENLEVLNAFAQLLDKTFYSYQWTIPSLEESVLISFEDAFRFSIEEFAHYCKNNVRQRLRFNKNTPIEEAVSSLYKSFKDEKTVVFEESRLEKKYPEFKALMREYEEGILLFEATKIEVWDKASSDTIGLQEFYAKNKGLYEWKERARVHTYSLHTDEEKEAGKIRKYVQKKGLEKAIAKYNQEETHFSYQDNTYEIGSRDLLGLEFKSNVVSDLSKHKGRKGFQFKHIVELYPKAQKSMSEARGYIIADYQDHLERQWISELKKRYPVDVDETILNDLFKSE